jgi:hypothetical protein
MISLLFALVAATAATSTVASPLDSTGTFLWFSDIHFDPYYGSDQAVTHHKLGEHHDCSWANKTQEKPLGDFGCDSPKALLESILMKAGTSFPDADFLVMTGDFARHSTEEIVNPPPINATESILYNASQMIQQYIRPGIPVVPAIGNNDVTPDYFLDITKPDEMLGMVSRGFSPILRAQNSSTAIHFEDGGYFAQNVTAQITVLSLNTIVYSPNHQPQNNNNVDDPLGQFDWLETQLNLALKANRSVYIIGHIPPTVGSYRHSQLWNSAYLERYYDILGRYHNNNNNTLVKAQLFGHIHTDEFRIIDDQYPLFLTSSFTPIYGSNPSFRIVTYDTTTLDLLDYQVYYIDLANTTSTSTGTTERTQQSSPWRQGELFTDAFRVPDMSLQSLQIIVKDLQNSTDQSIYWEALLSRLHVYTHGKEVCSPTCRQEWACTLTSTTQEQYEACLLKMRIESQSYYDWVVLMAVMLISVAVLAAFLAIGIRCCRQCYVRRHYKVPNSLELNPQYASDEVGQQERQRVTPELT